MGVRWSEDLHTTIKNPEPQNQPQLQPAPQAIQVRPRQAQSIPARTQKPQRLPSSSVHDTWEVNKPFELPLNAVLAGYDIDGKTMYVGRAFHKGDYIPAKAFNIINLATFPYNGAELFVMKFEYLVGDKYIWVSGQPFPTGAIVVNPLSKNEHLYVGRCNHSNSLVCGKFLRSKNCLYIPFGLKEVAITENFEILVHKDRYKI